MNGPALRLLALVWLSALSCRAPILAVGPVLPQIIADAGLSYSAAGFLYALPVLMMGLLAIPGGLVVDRVGAGRVIGVSLVAVGLASVLRGQGSLAALFAGTVLLGGFVGALQPGLPRVVRECFPGRLGLGTAVYAFGFTGGTVVAVALTSWLASRVGGWRAAFVLWGGLAAVTALGWLPFRRLGTRGGVTLDPTAFGAVLRDGLLWRIAFLQTMNSAAFFGANAWLSAHYQQTYGWPLHRAAVPLTLFNAVGAAAGFVAPLLSDRVRRRRPILVWTCALSVVGAAGLLAPVGGALLWATLFGIGLFASYTINLALPVDVAPPARVGAATGVVFSVGHAGGLLGPQIWGGLLDLTGRHEAGLAVMLAMVIVMTALAFTIPETYGGRRKG